MRRILFIFLFSFILSCGYAKDAFSPLPPDKAFEFSAYLAGDQQLILQWNIAPGYYLYKSQFSFTPATTNHVPISKIELPKGRTQQNSVRGVYQAYTGIVKILIPLNHRSSGLLNLNVNYQGCSHAGFCYTPIKKALIVNLSEVKAPLNLNPYVQGISSDTFSAPPPKDAMTKWLGGHNLFVLMLGFLGLGLLLAFTPCVLPMVPILSGIIVGQHKKAGVGKAFLLSVAYVAGMAITYAILGIMIALVGSNLQAQLQKPWIIVLFSGLFVWLALSLFGFYELQLPIKWQQRLLRISNQQKGGTYLGVFLMGSLSSLLVSPCVSAPLVGILAYIGQTGDVLLGAMALLALGIGMGLPLLLIGISADKWLPKAGAWMITVERLFGIVMLGLAIWMLSRMIPGPITLFLWALLCLFAAIFLGVFSPAPRRLQWIIQIFSILILFYGIILWIGAIKGNTDPLHPWEQFKNFIVNEKPKQKLSFVLIKSMKELDDHLLAAKKLHQPVILDFYADWCTACVLMDGHVFTDQRVKKALQPFMLLRADVTNNNSFDQALLKRFQVIGPPTILFFNKKGEESISKRIVGEVNANEFLAHIKEQQET
ncbi:MAG: hypothetical protein ACD_60C00106G0004 [uncultured bacterium]|nr:MAG: hypothetical protein ACD_60C00106G0004 [uncultured bacterium]